MPQNTRNSSGGGSERNPSRRPWLWAFSLVILVIVVVTFVGTPALSGLAGGQRLIFGRYRGEPIEYIPGNYFARQQQALADQVRDSGDTSNIESALFQIWRGAFDRTVVHTAIMMEAEESGMTVSEGAVDERLARYPQFMENGVFSPERFRQASSQEISQLRSFFSESLVHDLYLDDVLSNLRSSSGELAFFSQMAALERRFRFVRFGYSDYPQEEVIAFGEENADLFRQVALSSITITASESEAESVREQIVNQTASFEDLAQTFSTDNFAEEGGERGTEFFYELERDFADPSVLEVLTTLEQGDITPVLETNFGWVIYRLDEEVQSPDFEDEETLQTVRSYVNNFERGRIEDFMLSRAESFGQEAAEQGFVQAAADRGLQAELTSYFPINYGNLRYFGSVQTQDGAQLSNAAFREPFFEELFAIDEDEVSEPVILRDFVLVAALEDERETDGVTDEMESFLPLILQQFQAQEVERIILNPDDLEDNFNQAFQQFVLGTN